MTCEAPLLALRQDTMNSPQRHRDFRRIPTSRPEMARLRLRALHASVVTICAKRSQFRAGGQRLRIGDWGLRIVKRQPGTIDGGVRAKRSQTWADWGMWAKIVVWTVARPGSETCKTNPIWHRPGAGAGGEMRKTNPISLPGQMVGSAHPAKRTGPLRWRFVQNEPNSARRGRAPEAKCAKRTQLGRGRFYVKALPVKRLWSFGRFEGRAKQTQLGAGSPTIADWRLRIGRCRAGTPNPFDYRSGQALRRAETCKTNPIGPGRSQGRIRLDRELRKG